MLEKILKRNLLKYSAGRAITCPKCGKIADYRKWVIWESPNNRYGAHCADCWLEGLALIHDDKPHSYLLSIGWKIDTLVDFDKKARKAVTYPQKPGKAVTYPQKPGKALDTFLRRDIQKGHTLDRKTRKKTIYPAIVHSSAWPLTTNEDGQWSNPMITADYVREYCRLNNLTM